MAQRRNVSFGSIWEPVVGYSRAVRVGPFVTVAGTTAANPDGTVHAPGDPYGQTKRILEVITRALAEAGAAPQDVVRTRIFVTDISAWEAVGRAHAELFADIRPAATMVQVGALIHPDLVVEIEADAIIAAEAGLE